MKTEPIQAFVRNNEVTLTDFTVGLDAILSCFYENYWFMPAYKAHLSDGKYHFLKPKLLRFPTGLLSLALDYFEKEGVICEVEDLRRRPDPEMLNLDRLLKKREFCEESLLEGIVLRDYQFEAIIEAIAKGRGILELATGSGKTEIAAGIIKSLGLKTLFLVHTKDLLQQTAERFEKRLGREIGVAGAGRWEVGSDIVVATVQTLDARLKDKEKRNDTKDFLNSFQILFQDECHHSSASSWYKIGMYCHYAYYRFGLSGTPLRRDVLSNMKVLALMGPPIYQKHSMELIDAGHLSNIEVEMVDNPEIVPAQPWQETYNDGVVRSEARNNKICDLAVREFKAGKRVFILVRRIEHGETLTEMIMGLKNIRATFLHGKHQVWERENVKHKFNIGQKFILIASPIFDEGVDLPEINVLINAAGGKSETKTIQIVGRGLRKKKDGGALKVYDFQDASKFLKKHSAKRLGVYKKEGFIK